MAKKYTTLKEYTKLRDAWYFFLHQQGFKDIEHKVFKNHIQPEPTKEETILEKE